MGPLIFAVACAAGLLVIYREFLRYLAPFPPRVRARALRAFYSAFLLLPLLYALEWLLCR